MQGADALFVIAEISIALAGFTGVLAALYARGSWHPLDKWRTISLLLAGFVALGIALLPFGLYSLGLDGSALWRTSSAVFVGAGIAATVVVVRYQPPRASIPQFSLTAPLFWSVVSINLLAQLLNALGVLTSGTFGVFYLGLVVNLLVGGMQFTNIILIRPTT